jgi:hypothetical protein
MTKTNQDNSFHYNTKMITRESQDNQKNFSFSNNLKFLNTYSSIDNTLENLSYCLTTANGNKMCKLENKNNQRNKHFKSNSVNLNTNPNISHGNFKKSNLYNNNTSNMSLINKANLSQNPQIKNDAPNKSTEKNKKLIHLHKLKSDSNLKNLKKTNFNLSFSKDISGISLFFANNDVDVKEQPYREYQNINSVFKLQEISTLSDLNSDIRGNSKESSKRKPQYNLNNNLTKERQISNTLKDNKYTPTNVLVTNLKPKINISFVNNIISNQAESKSNKMSDVSCSPNKYIPTNKSRNDKSEDKRYISYISNSFLTSQENKVSNMNTYTISKYIHTDTTLKNLEVNEKEKNLNPNRDTMKLDNIDYEKNNKKSKNNTHLRNTSEKLTTNFSFIKPKIRTYSAGQSNNYKIYGVNKINKNKKIETNNEKISNISKIYVQQGGINSINRINTKNNYKKKNQEYKNNLDPNLIDRKISLIKLNIDNFRAKLGNSKGKFNT